MIEVEMIMLFGYGGYNLPHVNNANFHENKIAPLFLYITESNFLEQNRMK